MDTSLNSLTDNMSGSFAIRTSSGTMYFVRLDAPREIVRLAENEASSPEYAHLLSAQLRRDGEPIGLLGIIHVCVGQCAMLWLDVRRDGIPTLRTTTPVLSIVRLTARQSI